jgi:hypothetical protein
MAREEGLGEGSSTANSKLSVPAILTLGMVLACINAFFLARHMPEIPAFGRLRWEDLEFEGHLGLHSKPCLKKTKQKFKFLITAGKPLPTQ